MMVGCLASWLMNAQIAQTRNNSQSTLDGWILSHKITQNSLVCIMYIVLMPNLLLLALLRMDLPLSNYRGQCYDGASNKSEAKGGVAAQLTAIES